MQWNVAVEGDSDVAVLGAVLRSVGHELQSPYVCNGKSGLDQRLKAYAKAGLHSPWLVVRDLDQDADCAPSLLDRLRPGGAPGIVRIAVRAIEAWLLADRVAVAHWLGVPMVKVPADVERLANPKQALIELARRSRRREIRRDIPPRGTASIGPGYVDQVRVFCADAWRPGIAGQSSASLARCLKFLRGRSSRP